MEEPKGSARANWATEKKKEMEPNFLLQLMSSWVLIGKIFCINLFFFQSLKFWGPHLW